MPGRAFLIADSWKALQLRIRISFPQGFSRAGRAQPGPRTAWPRFSVSEDVAISGCSLKEREGLWCLGPSPSLQHGQCQRSGTEGTPTWKSLPVPRCSCSSKARDESPSAVSSYSGRFGEILLRAHPLNELILVVRLGGVPQGHVWPRPPPPGCPLNPLRNRWLG